MYNPYQEMLKVHLPKSAVIWKQKAAIFPILVFKHENHAVFKHAVLISKHAAP